MSPPLDDILILSAYCTRETQAMSIHLDQSCVGSKISLLPVEIVTSLQPRTILDPII